MTLMPDLARRFVVAKYSVVRKLGAFHLMPSCTEGSTSRINFRRASISDLCACTSEVMNASTAEVESAEVACAALGLEVGTVSFPAAARIQVFSVKATT